MNFKYELGQAVMVRPDLQDGGVQYYMFSGPGANKTTECATWDMCKLAGEIVHISQHSGSLYRVKEDPNDWNWSDEMFTGSVGVMNFISLL